MANWEVQSDWKCLGFGTEKSFKELALYKLRDTPFSSLKTGGQAVGMAVNIEKFVGRKIEGNKIHADDLSFSH